jgi:hypothetical protein
MSRTLTAALVLMLVAMAGGPAGAQFGNPLKKVLPPSPAPAPAQPVRKPFCHSITEETLDRFMKGLEKRRQQHAALKEAEARARADADAAAKQQGDALMAAMDVHSKCKDQAQEKHPKYQEQIRANNQANAAYDRGDQAAGDRFNALATELADLIDKDVEKACEHVRPNMFGTGPVAEEAARDHQKMIEYGQCVEAAQKNGKDPRQDCTMPIGGQGPATRAAQAQQNAANRAMQDARSDVDKKAAEAAGMDENEFGRINECVAGRLDNPTATPTTPETNAAIDARAPQLRAALGQ